MINALLLKCYLCKLSFAKYFRIVWGQFPFQCRRITLIPAVQTRGAIFFCVVFFGTMMILRGSLLTQGVTSSSRAWSPWVSSETLMILNLRGSAVFTFWSNHKLGQRKIEYYWLRIISNRCLKWAGNLKFHPILISWVRLLEQDGRLPLQRVWQKFWRGSQLCSTPN